MTVLSAVHRYIDDNAPRYVDALCDLIRRPSVTGHLEEVTACADHLAAGLGASGWNARAIHVDAGAPVVYATRPGPPGRPTVLLYSHYDVISPEPVDEWTYPPFSAERVGGRIFGRGATDAKANVLALVFAVEALAAVDGDLPCGIALVLDGEEERGSPNLPAFVDQFADDVAADAALSLDGGVDPSGVPKIGLGTSGMVYLELSCTGSPYELHSSGARLFANPAWRIVWALASIKGPDERILVDGFDDKIRPPTPADRSLMAAVPWDDGKVRHEAGVDGYVVPVSGPAALERMLFQPGLTICGIHSGFDGAGPKAVIPNRASAKLEFRIVPDQTPEEILALVRKHLDDHGFGDVAVDVLATVETAKTAPDTAILTAVTGAATDLYGTPVVKPTEEYAGRQGAWLGSRLGIPGVQSGIGPPGYRGHATDEFVTEEHYVRGIKFVAELLARFGRTG